MSLTKEAIAYLMEQGIAPEDRIIEVGERIFAIDNQGDTREILPRVTRAKETLKINTLSGVVGYIKASLERKEAQFYLQVYDEETVYLKNVLDSEGGRETLVKVSAIVPTFEYGRFLKTEEMIIALQSKFVENEDSKILLQVVGNITEENVKTTSDDGTSQTVTAKSGVSTVENILVPNPVSLAPYRTFLEVDQPTSDFVFRMQDGPKGAIFEADGGAWRNQAITNIREYLAEELADEISFGKITIIA